MKKKNGVFDVGGQADAPKGHAMTRDTTAEAAGWLAASHDDDMDWDAFTVWLEQSPDNGAEFDALAALDEALDQHAATLAPIGSPIDVREAPARPRWLWIAGSIAAGLIAVATPLVLIHPATDVVYAAPADSDRTVPVGDAKVTLSPGSQITLAKGNDDRLALSGSGYFDVPHRSGRVLAIGVGNYRITDIGTRFEVFGSGGLLRVAVARGTVTVSGNQLSEPVAVTAGHRLVVDDGAGNANLATIAAQDVGSWRRGRLVYDQAPLALVVAELAHYDGRVLSIDRRLADRRFSGTLAIGDGTDLARTLAAAAGLRLETHGNTERLVAVGG